MRLRRPAMSANLALSAASLVVCLLVLEVAARIERGTRDSASDTGAKAAYFMPDARLGWRKEPGARVVYAHREYTVEVVINSRGLRDVERDYVRPASGFRVLALGDSFIEGFTVADEDTVTRRLERRLAGPTCTAEVLNAGTQGYSTDQEYLFYREEGVRYSPDVVVLFFFYNDVFYNARSDYHGLPKPLLEAVPDGLRIKNEPLPALRLSGRPPAAAPPGPQPRLAAWEWLRERVSAGAPRAYAALAGLGLWAPQGRVAAGEALMVYRRRERPIITEGWSRTREILRVLARDVEDRGSRLLVAYIPSLMEVSDRDWEVSRTAYDWGENWDRMVVIERLRELAASVGFRLLDLTPALREAHGDFVGRVYLRFDSHWNERGHEVAASAVHRFMLEAGWLPAHCSEPST